MTIGLIHGNDIPPIIQIKTLNVNYQHIKNDRFYGEHLIRLINTN